MRKQILILGHDYTTQFVDIFNQYTRLFDRNLYDVTVAYLTGEPDEEIKKRTLAENVIFLNIPKSGIRSLKIKAVQKLLSLTREKQFHIVVCHRYKPTYIMMWVSRFHKIPLLISVMHELDTLASVKRRLFIACAAPGNMLFAGVSNAVRDDLRKSLWFIPKERIITLYNMVDVDLTEPQLLSRDEARSKLLLPEDAVVFGTLGRLVKNKDQTTLIQAFSLIKPYCPKAKLVIMGSGELEASLKQQIRDNHLDNDILLTGYLSVGFRYMKAFDCFVLSSIQEAFGRVLLEAMIAKLPIIATRVHGIPEVVANAGILVEPKDPVNLATAMQRIYELSPQAREERGDAAYQHAVKHFSIPLFYKQFWQLPAISALFNPMS
ncbi:N-acetylgalactosamine-N, N'-diacetylbacillosaminyl-diphospho-undecaprenol 4-alpha-N-acetylgalactosaminyltransferase [Aquicella siphonis]|uniref:N-acetylgalactosamine-N, N'-diacetylbacillosaminyl-diphospho-undecaprenol 4-alpha-N-acetylgalactosaminyltransferase n=1 Tax=Aquicella siphonis TaxID=254247 RepID=A0A5E4PJA5_9COXI|nr:glycosyltransferase [Aquicella siphonis]VVC76462.1 N-acetylgalactosamine-N, N'-diacetylbacillosaminyl-diphospho-undecaprenol 4-alpha-N-acetylgalactosaminyltransferase [Aquicella siphonis]